MKSPQEYAKLAEEWADRAGQTIGYPSAVETAAVAQVYATLSLAAALAPYPLQRYVTGVGPDYCGGPGGCLLQAGHDGSCW